MVTSPTLSVPLVAPPRLPRSSYPDVSCLRENRQVISEQHNFNGRGIRIFDTSQRMRFVYYSRYLNLGDGTCLDYLVGAASCCVQ